MAESPILPLVSVHTKVIFALLEEEAEEAPGQLVEATSALTNSLSPLLRVAEVTTEGPSKDSAGAGFALLVRVVCAGVNDEEETPKKFVAVSVTTKVVPGSMLAEGSVAAYVPLPPFSELASIKVAFTAATVAARAEPPPATSCTEKEYCRARPPDPVAELPSKVTPSHTPTTTAEPAEEAGDRATVGTGGFKGGNTTRLSFIVFRDAPSLSAESTRSRKLSTSEGRTAAPLPKVTVSSEEDVKPQDEPLPRSAAREVDVGSLSTRAQSKLPDRDDSDGTVSVSTASSVLPLATLLSKVTTMARRRSSSTAETTLGGSTVS
mmetsp:Transcript_10802/g.19983  ORF Transcript_10802/g.19983 Transcript_10802/m.19983 type:complete len:321 (-) Transcript_10802:317-1279(-)